MNLKAGWLLTSIWLGVVLLVVAPGDTRAALASNEAVTSHQVSVTEVKAVTGGEKATRDLPGKTAKEPAVSEQEAVKVVMSAFPHLPSGGEPEISLEQDYLTGAPIWRINMYEHSRYRPGPSDGFHATVDAVTGEILNVQWHKYAPAESTKGIITREQARLVAEKLARQLQPDKFNQLTYNDQAMDQYYPRESINIVYSFAWERTHNGVTVGGDGIRITVEALTGKVQSYDFRWQSILKLPAPATTVDPEKLAERVVDEAGLVLIYKVFDGRYAAGAPELKLVYQLNSSQVYMVDAATGAYLDYSGKEPAEAKLYENYAHIKGNANPPAGSDRISSVKAQAEAEKFFKLIGLEGNVERSGGGSSSGPLGRQEYWSYGIREDGVAGSATVSLGLETLSGRVSDFSRHGPAEYGQVTQRTVSRAEAEAKARDFIKQLNPEYAGHVTLNNASLQWAEDSGYQFSFIRVANGIPFPMNGIHIRLAGDGEVLNYRCDWHYLNFPGVGDVISPEAAAGKWLEKASYKLSYYFPLSYESRITPAASEAKLIYHLDAGIDSVDALTGAVLNRQGQPVNGQAANSYDFTGSWAAQSLQLLAGSGLLPSPDKFDLTAPVTRRDSARVMAAAAMQHYGHDLGTRSSFQDVKASDPDFRTIELLAELGIIDRGGSFNPEQQLTRQELATWLIDAAGHKDVTAIPNRITSPFQDIAGLTGQEQNYLGLAYGLGFMMGDSAYMFRPGDAVTWEELSAVITRALPQIRKNAAW